MSSVLCRIHSAGNGSVTFGSGRISLAIDAARIVRGRAGCSARQQLLRNTGKAAALRKSSPLINQGVHKTP
jgi:hypothetical protein